MGTRAFRRGRATLGGCLIGLLAACGGEDGGGVETTLDADAVTDTSALPDIVDTSQPDAVTPDVDDFGDRCEGNGECESGWCVPTSDGTVCTKGCGQGCPAGWACGTVFNRGTDGVNVCLDRTVALCHPCETDADCRRFEPEAGHRCLDFGDAGGFCGITCSVASADCPDGYVCEAEGEGEDAGQCRPADDAPCTCNPLAVSLQLSTTCARANDVGVCTATRRCTEDGLTACTAAAAVPESCNGRDDDCNGLVDDGVPSGGECQVVNEVGSCDGASYCVAGAMVCVGQEAEEERCDGLDNDCDGETDEGFPDMDEDGVADCVDDDIDGDGTTNDEDCAPEDPAISPTATEACDGVDNDCDGATNEEGAVGCDDYFQDADGDQFGSDTVPARCLCAPDEVNDFIVAVQGDCDDGAPAVNEDAEEICNGVDDDCDSQTDEGVQAPCGGCVNVCFLASGPGTPRAFDPDGGHTTNLVSTASDGLRLAPDETEGTYRQVLEGWPTSGTSWSTFFLNATTPSPSAIEARWRTAATADGLSGAAWSEPLGPYPPANPPTAIGATGDFIEIELRLTTAVAGQSPEIHSFSVLSQSVQ